MSDINERDRSRERVRRERPSRFSDQSRDRSLDRGRDRGGAKSSSCRVYVSNIPYEYRWQDLKDLFRNEVGEVQFVELFVDENDKPRGCGIVEFSDQQSVKKCMEKMQRFEVKGRQLIIKEDSGNMRDKYGHVMGSGKRGGGGGGRDDSRVRNDRFGVPQMNPVGPAVADKWGNTYGLSTNFLDSLSISLPLASRVFVANLDYKVDKKKLKEVFRLAGRVLRVELHTDKDGRSKGFAVVEYDHPVEAVQAISMLHNQVLYDRAMTVRMDRVNDISKLPEGLRGVGMGLGTSGEPLKDVARNLPSLSNGSNPGAANGAGILGAVPNPALQVASALTGLTNVGGSGIGGLTSNPQALQAATLSNLLGNGLGAGDLSSLVQNSSSQLAGNNTPSNLSVFGRENQNASFNSNQNFGSGRNFDSFDSAKGGNFGFGSDNFSSRGQTMNSSMGQTGRFSNKILITNLPPTASYKMLHDKFSEFGEVQHLEEKGNGGMLVVYNSDWQAERAIKNLDRARIDGRTIEARLYY